MTKRMLIDSTHPEETRVAVISNNKLEEYDYETLVRKQLKSNIYLVKVTRVEPSLQAAFVDFGGNRHGFLPFPEIHPDYYRIPIADRQALIDEERALAAAQAAKEDAEDAAELAASGQTLEDLDEEGDEAEDAEEGTDEDYLPQHTGSIAEMIPQEELLDSEEEQEDEESEEETPEETPEESEAASAGVSEATEDDNEEAEDEEPLETVGGGDVSESFSYRPGLKRKYKIQEVIKRGQIMLIQISKEERGNKGAAVTSYISLPGRYCVLMPNSPRGGGVSRKVSNIKDRQRLKKILADLNVPEGMSVILRTAGVSRSKAEIKRDLDYLLRLWDQIRDLTLRSTAPALIYEEGNLIKRAIRDLYRRDIAEVHVAGEEGFKSARDFMKTLMPSHAERINMYQDPTIPLFSRYQVEKQIDEIHNPTVHLRSGGYIVINPTEAMVSVDVNSGRATKGRHIEETALKTNLEAADEIARQLRLRDQGGLVVIDFIDMEDRRNNRIVEKRLRDAMQTDRARIQLGRISAFGLLELSRQRLNPSLVETNFETCKHCNGTGMVRTVETAAVMLLRAIEDEGIRGRASEIKVSVHSDIALYIFNHKREMLADVEKRHNFTVFIHANDALIKPNHTIEVVRASGVQRDLRPHRNTPVSTVDMSDLPDIPEDEITDDSTVSEDSRYEEESGDAPRERSHNRGDRGDRNDRNDRGGRNRRNRGGRNRGRDRDNRGPRPQHAEAGAEGAAPAEAGVTGEGQAQNPGQQNAEGGDRSGRRNRRRRGRRGGREGGRREGGGQHGQPQGEGSSATPPGLGEQPVIRENVAVSGGGHSAPYAHSTPAANQGGGQESQGEKGEGKSGWWKRLTE
jgi:ribonuclease E